MTPFDDYRNYRQTMKALSTHNTTSVTEFMRMNTREKFMTLFSLTAATRIKMDIQMKLLWLLLSVSIGSSIGVAYSIIA